MPETTKRSDVFSRALSAATILLLGAVTFYGNTVVSSVGELNASVDAQRESIHDNDNRLTKIESSNYDIGMARQDFGVLTDKLTKMKSDDASFLAKQDMMLNELEQINNHIGQLVTKVDRLQGVR